VHQRTITQKEERRTILAPEKKGDLPRGVKDYGERGEREAAIRSLRDAAKGITGMPQRVENRGLKGDLGRKNVASKLHK